jgi:hypothetical protein
MLGKVITMLSNGSQPVRSHVTDQKFSTHRAASSDGAQRSRSNVDAVAARPTTPSCGAAVGSDDTSRAYESTNCSLVVHRSRALAAS